MDLSPLLALGSSGGEKAQGGGWSSLLLLFTSLLFVWWFIYLGPQLKRQKARDKMLGGVKKGDRVVTRGGLIGVVHGVREKEKIVVLRISDNVKIEVVRSAVETVLTKDKDAE